MSAAKSSETYGDAERTPMVTIVVPARNSEAFIEPCIEAINDLDYPRDRLEVLVVDGQSEDETRFSAISLIRRFGLTGRVLSNPGRSISSNLNVGLAAANGSILCRIDVKARVPRHYLRTAVDALDDESRSVVGGGILALPSDEGPIARAIARSHNNWLVMGGGTYRKRGESHWAETVYLGCFRVSELERVQGWNVELAVNEDYDLCQRLGGDSSVWFDDRLTVDWIAPARLAEIPSRYAGFGRSKVVYWRRSRATPARRQGALISLGVAACVSTTMLVFRFSPKILAGHMMVAAATLLAIDERFGPKTRPSLQERLASALVVSPLVGLGWLWGVTSQFARFDLRSIGPAPGGPSDGAVEVAQFDTADEISRLVSST